MNNRNLAKDLFELNIAVLFISSSGVLGRFIDMPVPITIGLRAFLAAILLFLYCKWKGINFRIESKDRKVVLIGGVLLGVHWAAYFYALQLSNIAIGMLSLFTYPAITAILEPIILKTKILKFHVLLTLMVLVGIYFLVPEFNLQSDNLKAVGFGVLSAICYSVRNIMMKTKVQKYDGSLLMFYQLIAMAIVFSPFYLVLDYSRILEYLPATLILALVTTCLGHTLFLHSLNKFSTITASIVSCAQPVYGIILGMIVLQEFPHTSTLIGGGIIILTVVAESVRIYRLQVK